MRNITRTTRMLSLTVGLALAVTPLEAARTPKRYTIEQFMATTTYSGASFSPDEKRILYTSNQTGVPNVYSKPVSGGEGTAVTSSTTDSTYAVSYFPRDDRVLFTHDVGGNENNHLYVRESDGSIRDLTPGEKTKARFLDWSANKREFFISTNERDPRNFDIYRVDANTYNRVLFFKNPDGYEIADISRDQKWVALDKPLSTSDADLYLANVRTGELKHLTPHTEPIQFSAQSFDPASTRLYYLSDEGSEFARVKSYHLASGKHEEVEKADWDIFYTLFSENGRYRVTAINEDARTVIKIRDSRTGRLVTIPNLPPGDITAVRISPSENLMAFYLSGDRSPANLYVYDFRTRKATRLTDALSREINASDLVDAEVVRFKASDGLTIPSVLFKPHEASPENKAPALVWVHGGPGGQTRHGYSSLMQYLANHGYVILGINNRGSSGYGKTFYTADDKKHGREPLRDCIEGKNFLASLPYVDPDKIAIIGGSYGGYMVLAALTLAPEEFAAGVDLFGISNWVRTLESIPPYWESFRVALYKEIGDPVADKEELLAVSPLFHATKIKRPLMVLQGANDPRVIKPESDDIVEAARKNGIPVEYVVFPDEGHGFTKKPNQIKAWQSILVFLDKYVKQDGSS